LRRLHLDNLRVKHFDSAVRIIELVNAKDSSAVLRSLFLAEPLMVHQPEIVVFNLFELPFLQQQETVSFSLI
jgi:hypothetical protein